MEEEELEQCIACGKFTIDPSDRMCRNINCTDISANLDAEEDANFLN